MLCDLLNTFEEIMLLRIRCRYAATIDTEFIILNEIYFFSLPFAISSAPFSLLPKWRAGFV